MATGNNFHQKFNNKNLEIFSLIWLDPLDDPKEIRRIEKKFRSIINHLIKFNEIQSCQNYLDQTSSNDRLILIVTGRLGSEIVPNINKYRQILSIYIYCMDKEANEKWSRQYTKVKGVFIDVKELIKQLNDDYQILKDLEEPLSIDYYQWNISSKKFQSGMNNQFGYFQIFLDNLLQIPSNQFDRTEFFQLIQTEYKDNRNELTNFNQFEREYSSNNVLSWLLTDSFFSKSLRGILCQQNYSLLYLYRSYLIDIWNQLKECQSKEYLKVYRYQMISKEELQKFQENLNQFMSIHSFFSGKIDKEKARLSLKGTPPFPDPKIFIFCRFFRLS